MTNLRTRATGAGQFSSPQLILTNSCDAHQGVKNECERTRAGAIPLAGAKISRRSIMNMFVGSAAVAGATVLPCQPVAAKALAVETEHASQELRDLILELDKAHDVLMQKAEVYEVVYAQWKAWSATHPEPRKYGTRIYRKWIKWHDRLMDKIGFYDARDAKMAAAEVHKKARTAVAKFESRHLNDVALKVAAAHVFEAVKGTHEAIICQGVTIDMGRMALAGSYPVVN